MCILREAPNGIGKISQTRGKQAVRADLKSAVQLPSIDRAWLFNHSQILRPNGQTRQRLIKYESILCYVNAYF